jgi:DNA-binding winged helix-turn-helix (wHTH) protein
VVRVRFGDCLLDSETRLLFVRGEEIHVHPKAFQFLELLLQNRPKAISKGAVHERLWPGTFVSDSTLTSLVAEVRHAIGDDAHESLFVRTVHRFGYAFSGAAQEARENPSRLSGCKFVYSLVLGRKQIPLELGESIIGRDPGASVLIDDSSVSRRHARIIVSDEGATLEDLGSKNGTLLENTKVESVVPLSDGDVLKVGSIALTILIFPVRESTETGAAG